MKYLFYAFMLSFTFPLVSFASGNITGPTPGSGTTTNTPLTISCAGGNGWDLFDASNTIVDGGSCSMTSPINLFTTYGLSGDGTYTWVTLTLGDTTCVASGYNYATCLAAANGVGTYCVSGTSCAAPPSSGGESIIEATSTVDQTQKNAWNAYWTFFATMVFVVWLFRKN